MYPLSVWGHQPFYINIYLTDLAANEKQKKSAFILPAPAYACQFFHLTEQNMHLLGHSHNCANQTWSFEYVYLLSGGKGDKLIIFDLFNLWVI